MKEKKVKNVQNVSFTESRTEVGIFYREKQTEERIPGMEFDLGYLLELTKPC